MKGFLRKCYQVGSKPIWPAKRSAQLKRKFAKVNPEGVHDERFAQFTLQGELKPGNRKAYAINGEEFDVDEDTFVVGVLRVGCTAKVRGNINPGVGKCATRIVVVK